MKSHWDQSNVSWVRKSHQRPSRLGRNMWIHDLDESDFFPKLLPDWCWNNFPVKIWIDSLFPWAMIWRSDPLHRMGWPNCGSRCPGAGGWPCHGSTIDVPKCPTFIHCWWFFGLWDLGHGCWGSQIFKSSVFSCVVSISRRDILRSRLATWRKGVEGGPLGCWTYVCTYARHSFWHPYYI